MPKRTTTTFTQIQTRVVYTKEELLRTLAVPADASVYWESPDPEQLPPELVIVWTVKDRDPK